MSKKVKTLFKKLKKNNILHNYLMLSLAMFVSAINYNVFTKPLKIVAGGSNGLAIVVEDIFKIPATLFIFIFSLAALILGYLLIGKEKASSALVATFIYPIFISLTEPLTSYLVVTNNDIIIASIFAGAISGWVAGTTIKVGLSQGGITLIDQILYEKLKISISKSNFVINMLIVLWGSYCFGITSILYAVIYLYMSSIVIDKVLLGISENKSFYIITDKEKEVREYIVEDLKNSATIFNVKSGKDDNKSILMAAMPNNLYYKASKKIKSIDKKAFFIVVDSYEVNNGRNN